MDFGRLDLGRAGLDVFCEQALSLSNTCNVSSCFADLVLEALLLGAGGGGAGRASIVSEVTIEF